MPRRGSAARVAALGLVAAGALVACRGPNANEVEPGALAPRLLHDEAELAAYLEAFPRDQYQIADVAGVGRFWLDPQPDVVKGYLRAGKPWEPHVVALLREHVRPGTTALDVGAYVGAHAVTMAKLVGPEGRVYAFEPQKKIYRELRQNLALNGLANAVALRFALGAAPGVIEMDAPRPGNVGGTAIGSGGDRAELRTLDSFGFRNVSVVKIDVEGFEGPVIDGARETLSRCKPVIILEILGHEPTYELASPETRARFEAIFAKLTALGYEAPRLIWLNDYLVVPKKGY